MTTDNRRDLVLRRRDQLMKPAAGLASMGTPIRGLLDQRLDPVGFLFAVVVGVLAGVWIVSGAHLAEQFWGAPQTRPPG